MFLKRCQAEFLKQHIAKTCALRMMRFFEPGINRGIVKRGRERQAQDLTLRCWPGEEQWKKESIQDLRKKSGEILKFLSFFSFSSTVLPSPQVSNQLSLTLSYPFPALACRVAFSSPSAIIPKKRCGGIRGLPDCRSGRSLSLLVCGHLVEFCSAHTPQRRGSATGTSSASSAYVRP